MKRNIITLIFLIITFVASMSARTVTINLGASVGKDVTKQLRAQLSQLSPSDNVNIALSKKGNYYLSGTVEAKCNVAISGTGENSKFILCNGTDKGDFKAFIDDSFLEFIGTKEHPIAVDIHDISIDLQEHSGLWWQRNADGTRTEKFAVKIYHANRVSVKNVDSKLKNAFCTTFNLRICSNITFSNCKLTNYNNCSEGGIIWIEGATANVSITDNVFNKYGNDEALAFYGLQQEIKNSLAANGTIAKKDISITDNVFNYHYGEKGKTAIINDVLISFYSTETDNSTPCSFDNISFSSNKLNISDPVKITLLFRINKKETYSEFSIADNQFLNTKGNSNNKNFYKTDIKIEDNSDFRNKQPVEISNNSFINESAVITKWGSTGLSHIQMTGGDAIYTNNKINDVRAAEDQKGGILAFITASANLNLIGNSATGLEMLCCVSDGEGVRNVAINASDNLFEGATTIYCDKVQHLDLNFKRNTFRSANMNFFLQEFAKEGTVTFTNNVVSVKGGNGQLMTHWGNSDTKNMRFSKLIITGNTFYGVDNAKSMLINLQNIVTKTIAQNSYYH